MMIKCIMCEQEGFYPSDVLAIRNRWRLAKIPEGGWLCPLCNIAVHFAKLERIYDEHVTRLETIERALGLKPTSD
jgi:hypothetical protein